MESVCGTKQSLPASLSVCWAVQRSHEQRYYSEWLTSNIPIKDRSGVWITIYKRGPAIVEIDASIIIIFIHALWAIWQRFLGILSLLLTMCHPTQATFGLIYLIREGWWLERNMRGRVKRSHPRNIMLSLIWKFLKGMSLLSISFSKYVPLGKNNSY